MITENVVKEDFMLGVEYAARFHAATLLCGLDYVETNIMIEIFEYLLFDPDMLYQNPSVDEFKDSILGMCFSDECVVINNKLNIKGLEFNFKGLESKE
jgi:hypothetical protein